MGMKNIVKYSYYYALSYIFMGHILFSSSYLKVRSLTELSVVSGDSVLPIKWADLLTSTNRGLIIVSFFPCSGTTATSVPHGS
jgi:hypothetical protein